MITNLWNITDFYCSYRHDKPVKMGYNNNGLTLFYSCPKYYPENREPGEPACPMRLNMVDAEGILDKFSKIIEEDEDKDIYRNYKNFEFDYKSIHVKVLKYENDSIHLDIFNRKALR